MILVFGKTGQVATELQRSGDVLALGRDQADLSDSVACAQRIRAFAPRAVINRKRLIGNGVNVLRIVQVKFQLERCK